MQMQSDWVRGELVWVLRHGARGQFRVVWVKGTDDRERQIGIECIEVSFDWGVSLSHEADIVVDLSEDSVPWFVKPADYKRKID